MSKRLALIIGNSLYRDDKLKRLKSPDADVGALRDVLSNSEFGGFDDVNLVFNSESSVVRKEIFKFYARKKREDLLLFYFSGHGVLDENGRLYLAVKDTDTEALRGTAIPASYITDEMDNSRSKRQVLILDCCHSGAFERGTKGVTGARVGTANIFEGSGYGRVVLTASDATQYAWEGNQIIGEAENSLFTHFLIQGIQTGEADANQDGQITVDEIYDYAYSRILDRTPKQTPGKWSFKEQGDLIIAKSSVINPNLELTQSDPLTPSGSNIPVEVSEIQKETSMIKGTSETRQFQRDMTAVKSHPNKRVKDDHDKSLIVKALPWFLGGAGIIIIMVMFFGILYGGLPFLIGWFSPDPTYTPTVTNELIVTTISPSNSPTPSNTPEYSTTPTITATPTPTTKIVPSDTSTPTATAGPVEVKIYSDADTGEELCLRNNCQPIGDQETIVIHSKACLTEPKENICIYLEGYFHFDLSQIPGNSQIISAEAHFYTNNLGPLDRVDIARVMSPWSEYDLIPFTDDWSENTTVDYCPIASGIYRFDEIRLGWNTWDLTSLIDYLYKNPAKDYGICVRAVNTSPNIPTIIGNTFYVSIFSREGPTTERPYILVKYDPLN